MIRLKSQDEIKRMREAGRVVAHVLKAVGAAVDVGVSTAELNEIALDVIAKMGAKPSFLGYGDPPFPGAICVSVDDEVVHGIPRATTRLSAGQIVSVDVGAYLDGFHGDAARTFLVGDVAAEVKALVSTTKESFFEALKVLRPGCRVGDIGHAVQTHCEARGYGIVRELTGHGVGRDLHEDPAIPNYGPAGRGLRLEIGAVVAIEPMVTLGDRHVETLDDDWTVVTVDGQPAAHYENTVAITADGPLILTAC